MRTYTVNEAIFQSWTPASAYALGLIASDGSIGKKEIEITSVDIELLEAARTALNSNHPISATKGHSALRLRVGSRAMVNDLLRLGIPRNKSKILALPDVPDAVFFDFVRGCFDGDGGAYYKPGKSLFWKMTSGSITFLTQMEARISARLGIATRPVIEERGTKNGTPTCWYILVYLGEAALAIGHAMYEHADNLYLPRKRVPFQSYEQRPNPKPGNRRYDPIILSDDEKLAKLARKREHDRINAVKYRATRKIQAENVGLPVS